MRRPDVCRAILGSLCRTVQYWVESVVVYHFQLYKWCASVPTRRALPVAAIHAIPAYTSPCAQRWPAKTEQADKWIPDPGAARMPRNGRGLCRSVHDATTARHSRRRWPWQRSRVRRRWPNWRSFMRCIRRKSRHGKRNWLRELPACSGPVLLANRRFFWQTGGTSA